MMEIPRPESVEPERTILVTGATGRQGGAAARHLVDTEFRVRAMTRDPEQEAAVELARVGCEVVRGDFDDPDTLEAALDGVHGVFAVHQFWETGPEHEVEQGKRTIDLAARAGVHHYVYSSVASAHRDTGLPHFESKRRIEDHLRASGLSFTIVRPVFFMENWWMLRDEILGGRLPQPLSPDTPLQQVAVDDIGGVVALAFREAADWLGRTFELAGDELTMEQTAAAFADVLGVPVEHVQVPWEDFRDRAGDEMADMYEWFERVGYDVTIEAARKRYPGLTPFRDFLAGAWAGLAEEAAAS